MRLIKLTDENYVEINHIAHVSVEDWSDVNAGWRVVAKVNSDFIVIKGNLTHDEAKALLEQTAERINRIAHCGEED